MRSQHQYRAILMVAMLPDMQFMLLHLSMYACFILANIPPKILWQFVGKLIYLTWTQKNARGKIGYLWTWRPITKTSYLSNKEALWQSNNADFNDYMLHSGVSHLKQPQKHARPTSRLLRMKNSFPGDEFNGWEYRAFKKQLCTGLLKNNHNTLRLLWVLWL